jgi:hypothetical protein
MQQAPQPQQPGSPSFSNSSISWGLPQQPEPPAQPQPLAEPQQPQQPLKFFVQLPQVAPQQQEADTAQQQPKLHITLPPRHRPLQDDQPSTDLDSPTTQELLPSPLQQHEAAQGLQQGWPGGEAGSEAGSSQQLSQPLGRHQQLLDDAEEQQAPPARGRALPQLPQAQPQLMPAPAAATSAGPASMLEIPRPPPHTIVEEEQVEVMAPAVPGCMGLKCLELPATKYSDDFVRGIRQQQAEAAAAAVLQETEEHVGGSMRASEPWAALQLREGGTPGSSMHRGRSGSMRGGSGYFGGSTHGGSMHGGGSVRGGGANASGDGSVHGALRDGNAGIKAGAADAGGSAPAALWRGGDANMKTGAAFEGSMRGARGQRDASTKAGNLFGEGSVRGSRWAGGSVHGGSVHGGSVHGGASVHSGSFFRRLAPSHYGSLDNLFADDDMASLAHTAAGLARASQLGQPPQASVPVAEQVSDNEAGLTELPALQLVRMVSAEELPAACEAQEAAGAKGRQQAAAASNGSGPAVYHIDANGAAQPAAATAAKAAKAAAAAALPAAAAAAARANADAEAPAQPASPRAAPQLDAAARSSPSPAPATAPGPTRVVRFSLELSQMQEVRPNLDQDQPPAQQLQQKVAAAAKAAQLESPRPPPHSIAEEVEIMAPAVPGCMGLKCLELPATKYSDDFVQSVLAEQAERAASEAADSSEHVGGSMSASEPWAALQLRDGGTPGSSMHRGRSGSMRGGSTNGGSFFGGSMRSSLGDSMRSIGGSGHGILKTGGAGSLGAADQPAAAGSNGAQVSWADQPHPTTTQRAEAEAKAAAAAAQAAAKAALGAAVAAVRARDAAGIAVARHAGVPALQPMPLPAAFEEVRERARAARSRQHALEKAAAAAAQAGDSIAVGRRLKRGSAEVAALAISQLADSSVQEGAPVPFPELHQHIRQAAPLVERLAAQAGAAAEGGRESALVEVGCCALGGHVERRRRGLRLLPCQACTVLCSAPTELGTAQPDEPYAPLSRPCRRLCRTSGPARSAACSCGRRWHWRACCRCCWRCPVWQRH